jgi:Helix-turn-helix domain
MLVLDSIVPDKWYSVKEAGAILEFSDDTVIRRIKWGLLKAFVLPGKSNKRRRVYESRRIQGAELIRFIKTYLNPN